MHIAFCIQKTEEEMNLTGGKILRFDELTQARNHCWQEKRQYQCFVTEGRLQGVCQLLICEWGQQRAELFHLNFSKNGVSKQSYFYRNSQIKEWLDKMQYQEIAYEQALGMLGDAVRKNYKYQEKNNWLNRNPSLHLQRIWGNDFYNNGTNNLVWLLAGQNMMATLQIYLQALQNKDAVLLYDLLAEQAKPKESRDIYAMQWNHVLEELSIFDADIVEVVQHREILGNYSLFTTLYGENEAGKILSVDLHLEMLEEQGAFYILKERILEPRIIYRCLAQ